jgi:hypothetical protein
VKNKGSCCPNIDTILSTCEIQHTFLLNKNIFLSTKVMSSKTKWQGGWLNQHIKQLYSIFHIFCSFIFHKILSNCNNQPIARIKLSPKRTKQHKTNQWICSWCAVHSLFNILYISNQLCDEKCLKNCNRSTRLRSITTRISISGLNIVLRKPGVRWLYYLSNVCGHSC